MEKVVVAGGSGFIGRAVVDELCESGRNVVVLTRFPAPNSKSEFQNPRSVVWDGIALGDWTEALEGAEAVINLCGESVVQRWSARGTRRIRDSRFLPTVAIATAISQAKNPPKVWLNASAVGYYADSGERMIDETAPAGDDAMSRLCAEWEHCAMAADLPETRVVPLRIGLVLSRGGGALRLLEGLAGWFIGGHLGNGRQYVPWIHLRDVSKAAAWCIGHPIEGPVNVVGPAPCTNAEFMASIRSAVRRPWSPPVPAPVLKLIRAASAFPADLGLRSSGVLPRKLVDGGFAFDYPTLAEALG